VGPHLDGIGRIVDGHRRCGTGLGHLGATDAFISDERSKTGRREKPVFLGNGGTQNKPVKYVRRQVSGLEKLSGGCGAAKHGVFVLQLSLPAAKRGTPVTLIRYKGLREHRKLLSLRYRDFHISKLINYVAYQEYSSYRKKTKCGSGFQPLN
jgi:hypothetical protein